MTCRRTLRHALCGGLLEHYTPGALCPSCGCMITAAMIQTEEEEEDMGRGGRGTSGRKLYGAPFTDPLPSKVEAPRKEQHNAKVYDLCKRLVTKGVIASVAWQYGQDSILAAVEVALLDAEIDLEGAENCITKGQAERLTELIDALKREVNDLTQSNNKLRHALRNVESQVKVALGAMSQAKKTAEATLDEPVHRGIQND